jgi:cytochrome b involved in lipid metabolism
MTMGTAGTAGTLMEARKKKKKPQYEQPGEMVPRDNSMSIPKGRTINQPLAHPELPVFTREEVSEHCDEDSLWYTFRGAVYDLTAFYEGHPGGAPVSKSRMMYQVFHCIYSEDLSPLARSSMDWAMPFLYTK